jgi:hypothetical protein
MIQHLHPSDLPRPLFKPQRQAQTITGGPGSVRDQGYSIATTREESLHSSYAPPLTGDGRIAFSQDTHTAETT